MRRNPRERISRANPLHLDAETSKSERIDEKTGKLIATGQTLEVGSPVCAKLVPQ